MAVEGVDYSYGRPAPAQLYAAGKRFACRYVSWNRTGKNLSLAEAQALTAAGLAVVTNWEYDEHDQLGGFSKGVEHAQEADRQHRACGGPPGRPIYFSTDFDATATQLAGPVTGYFRGAASVLGLARVGVYGGIRTVRYMLDHALARWAWQTYAWSGGAWDARAHIHQHDNGVMLAGATLDLDRATKTDYGQWGQDMDAEQDRKLDNLDRLLTALLTDADKVTGVKLPDGRVVEYALPIAKRVRTIEARLADPVDEAALAAQLAGLLQPLAPGATVEQIRNCSPPSGSPPGRSAVDPLGGITITAREIYDAVVRLTGRVDVLIEQQTHTAGVTKDHESRLRSLERSRWPLHSLAVLTSIAALAMVVLRGG